MTTSVKMCVHESAQKGKQWMSFLVDLIFILK